MKDRLNMTSLTSGVVFIVLGVLFLLDRLGVLELSAGFVWPLLLIGLGVAVLAGGRRRRPRTEMDHGTSAFGHAPEERSADHVPSEDTSTDPSSPRH